MLTAALSPEKEHFTHRIGSLSNTPPQQRLATPRIPLGRGRRHSDSQVLPPALWTVKMLAVFAMEIWNLAQQQMVELPAEEKKE